MSPGPQSAEPEVTAAVAARGIGHAYLLAGADGAAVAATAVFRHLIGTSCLTQPALASAITAVTGGAQALAEIDLLAADGVPVTARVEAVLDGHGRRLALLGAPLPRPGAGVEAVLGWFPPFAAEAEAIVWLKDLAGRYVYVNPAYIVQLGADPGQVIDRSDAELGPQMAIDGPRHTSAGAPAQPGIVGPDTPDAEPLELEYMIPSFDRRPAYTALRFPIRDRDGQPLLSCGVASPRDRPEIAARTCDELLSVLEWYRGDAAALRAEVMSQWGLSAAGSLSHDAGGSPSLSGARPPRRPDPAADVARLGSDRAQRVTELESEVRDLRAALEHARAPGRGPEAPALPTGATPPIATPTTPPTATPTTPPTPTPATPPTATPTAASQPTPAPAALAPGWNPAAQRSLVEALGACSDVHSIFSEAVHRIGADGGWTAVAAWWHDEPATRFRCEATWLRSALEMVNLETTAWPVDRSTPAAVIERAGRSAGAPVVWLDTAASADPAAAGDPHLASLRAEGVTTVVLVPVRHAGGTIAVIEMCSRVRADAGAHADAALAGIAGAIAAATDRVTGSVTPWGRSRG